VGVEIQSNCSICKYTEKTGKIKKPLPFVAKTGVTRETIFMKLLPYVPIQNALSIRTDRPADPLVNESRLRLPDSVRNVNRKCQPRLRSMPQNTPEACENGPH